MSMVPSQGAAGAGEADEEGAKEGGETGRKRAEGGTYRRVGLDELVDATHGCGWGAWGLSES